MFIKKLRVIYDNLSGPHVFKHSSAKSRWNIIGTIGSVFILKEPCCLNQTTFPRILYSVERKSVIPLTLCAFVSLPLDFPIRRKFCTYRILSRDFSLLCQVVSHSLLWTKKLYKKKEANHKRHGVSVKLHFPNILQSLPIKAVVEAKV